LQDFLNLTEQWSGNDSYPKNAKIFLSRQGVPIQDYCRMNRDITEEQRGLLERLMQAWRQLETH